MLGTKSTQIKYYINNISLDWDNYVKISAKGTFLHLSGWKTILEKTYGYKPCYLFAESDGKIRGVLPLFLINNLLSGKALVSIPFGIYGGICADDVEIRNMLMEKAKEICKEEKAGYVEFRNSEKYDEMPTKELYATFVKQLPGKPGECLHMLPRKARAAARKAISSNLSAETGLGLLKDFYDVYATSVRGLGTPVFPLKYLKNIIAEFKDKIHILTVKYENRVIAGVFSFLYKDTIMPYYGGALSEYFKYQPNNFMYLKLMEWAVEKGYKYFDFGRSKKGTGSYKFKELQGFEAKPLYYQYWLNTLKDIPDTSSLSPKVQLFSNVWKRLPVWVTKVVGPKIIGLTPP